MRWLRDHGVTATYDDYLDLDERVLEDCRLLMWAEGQAQRRAEHYSRASDG